MAKERNWRRVSGERGWWQAAQKALKILSSKTWSTGASELNKIAEDSGLNVQTLKRAVAAYEFAIAFEARAGASLHEISMLGVEDLRKWMSYDPAGGEEAGKALAKGELSARRLGRLERDARKGGAPESALQRPSRMKDAATFMQQLCRGYELVPIGGRAGVLADFAYRLAEGEAPTDKRPASIAAVVYRQGARKTDSERRLNEALHQALGLTRLFTHVIAFVELPEGDDFLDVWRADKVGGLDRLEIIRWTMEARPEAKPRVTRAEGLRIAKST